MLLMVFEPRPQVAPGETGKREPRSYKKLPAIDKLRCEQRRELIQLICTADASCFQAARLRLLPDCNAEVFTQGEEAV